MNKVLAVFVLATVFAGSASIPAALADNHEPLRPGLPFVIKSLSDRVDRNAADIQTNAGHIADNFSAINGNAADISDLDARIAELEAGAGSGAERTVVDVDCITDPDALLNPPIGGQFAENTTYNISGACNGPLYVTRDWVYFVGVDPTAAIVLPASTTNPGNGAVFGDGAHDLRVVNLRIDASAWANPAGAAAQAAGVYARNAFVRVIGSDVVGGSYGINPYRNAIVRLEGEVNVTEFYNVGISAGDQSLITTRGQVNVSTTIANFQYLNAVESYRDGLVDLRRGLRVNIPPADEDNDFEPAAIFAIDHSQVRVRGGGVVDVNGFIYAGNFSSVTMFAGQANSDVQAEGGAVIFNGTNQTGEINLFEAGKLVSRSGVHNGEIMLRMGSVASLRHGAVHNGFLEVGANAVLDTEDADLGFVSASTSAVVGIGGGSVAGIELSQGSIANLSELQVFGDIALRDPLNLLNFEGFGFVGGNVYLCGSTLSQIGPAVMISGMVFPGCPPFGP